ncbi:hypothetical protein LCGC14_2013700 [marine sediment metagenome]|uniref:Uncharacterized protein n=1 Tax=marine sediment metagenome TaxID=412755 RepID=A0A0F9EZJ3_9ZZZZ
MGWEIPEEMLKSEYWRIKEQPKKENWLYELGRHDKRGSRLNEEDETQTIP